MAEIRDARDDPACGMLHHSWFRLVFPDLRICGHTVTFFRKDFMNKQEFFINRRFEWMNVSVERE